MPDFGDPYAALATALPQNPYLQMPTAEKPHWSTVVGNMLLGAGAGVSQADAAGRGWMSGIAPGLMYGTQLLGQQRKQQEAEQLKRLQMGIALQGLHDKQAERQMKLKGMQAWADANDPDKAPAPGFDLKPNPIRMAPDSYDGRTAGLEGGTRSGGMVYNELGSGAGGPYQIMPATWQDIRAKNPDLNLPEVMPVDSKPETRAMHDAAHSRFKAANAQALQAAGFQPTPDNLYLAHRFGVGGALSVLRSDPNKPLAEVLPIDWQRQNPDMRGQTAGGFRRLAAERMQGVGVPYEAPTNAQPTQYALQPDALPDFANDPVMSMLPRGSGRFMPGVLPNTDAAPSFTAPVMPQPQMPAQPAQYTPPAERSPAPSPQGAPTMRAPPPEPPRVPKPMLPRDEAAYLINAVRSGAMTTKEAESEKQKRINDLHKRNQDVADKAWQMKWDDYKAYRAELNKTDSWRTLSKAEARERLEDAYDEKKAYQVNKTGEVRPIGGGPQVQIDMGGKAVNEIAKQRVTNYEDKIRPAAQGAVNEIASMHTFRQLLDSGVFTGMGAEARLGLARFGELLGLPSDKATNTQALMGAAAERVLAVVKTLGANPSNADREYLEKAKGGNISFTEPGLRRILDIGERSARDMIKKHGEEVGRLRKLDGIKDLPEEFFSLSDAPDYASWSKENPLPPVTAPPPPPPPPNRRPLAEILGGAEQNRSPMPAAPAARQPLDQIFGSSP